jgi:hypothetical protein
VIVDASAVPALLRDLNHRVLSGSASRDVEGG